MNDIEEFKSGAIEQDSLANARWADPTYIAKEYEYKSGDIWLGRCPHDPNKAIGYKDDTHVFLCADTGGGKGRSFLINNQILWPGSMVTIGPKGDEASITAVRRGKGYNNPSTLRKCEGLGQDVYVLDPMGIADVPSEYRAHFNPLSVLRADDPKLVAKCDRIANSVCTMSDGGGDAKEWDRKGKNWVSTIIKHVVTDSEIKEKNKNLITVRRLIMRGDIKSATEFEEFSRKRARLNGDDQNNVKPADPFLILLKTMARSTYCRGDIADNAHDMLETYRQSPKLYNSIRDSAVDHLRWISGDGILDTIAKPTDELTNQRTFKASDLREKKISVFICLPEEDYDPQVRWLRTMTSCLLQALRETSGIPKNGEQILFCIDEFGNMGRMDDALTAINSIRSFGVKMMVATQRLGQVKKHYGDEWETFRAGGLEMYFRAEEQSTQKFIEDLLGKTEVTKYARSIGTNFSTAETIGSSESYAHTNSLSTSETSGTSQSKSLNQSNSKTKSIQKSKGKNYGSGSNTGKTAGRGYGPHLLIRPLEGTSNKSKNRGQSNNQGHSSQKSQGSSYTNQSGVTDTSGSQFSSTHQTGSSDTHTQTSNESKTETEGKNANIQESFQIKPLLQASEVREMFNPISERDHPGYPGLALVKMPKEDHFTFVRRSNYDEDRYFEDKFTASKDFDYIPISQQNLLGCDFKENDFYHIDTRDLDGSKLAKLKVMKPPVMTFCRSFNEGEIINRNEDLLILNNVIHKAPDYCKVVYVSEDNKAITLRTIKKYIPPTCNLGLEHPTIHSFDIPNAKVSFLNNFNEIDPLQIDVRDDLWAAYDLIIWLELLALDYRVNKELEDLETEIENKKNEVSLSIIQPSLNNSEQNKKFKEADNSYKIAISLYIPIIVMLVSLFGAVGSMIENPDIDVFLGIVACLIFLAPFIFGSYFLHKNHRKIYDDAEEEHMKIVQSQVNTNILRNHLEDLELTLENKKKCIYFAQKDNNYNSEKTNQLFIPMLYTPL